MPEFSLLGSLNSYTILSASGEKLIIDGPFFTCNELNLNSWGIPESEAAGFAQTFSGKPVRWCPMGKTVIDPDSGDVIAAEHYCDLVNSTKTIVGNIIDVYPNGRNDKGNLVYWQKAEITDSATVTGITTGKIPTNVSMWAYGTEMLDDGMVRGARGMSESIVTEPAYQEASFQYQIVAAALKKKDSAMTGNANVNDCHLFQKQKERGVSMESEKKLGVQTPPEATGGIPATPGVTINIAASDLSAAKKGAEKKDEEDTGDGHNAVCASCGEKLPAYSAFCPGCGASLHPKCAGCGASAPVGAKFCTSCGASMTPETPATGTTGDNTAQAAVSMQAAIVDALKKVKDEENRRTLAASIAEVQIRTGVITEADGPKTVEALFPMPASVLETQLTSMKLMASKIEASNEHGLQSGSLPGPMVKVGAGMLPKFAHGLPPENIIKAVFQRLGAQVNNKFEQMNWDHIFKYGSLKNVPGSAKWAGTYHQDRELLPL